MKVFISYSHKDKPFAMKLAQELQSHCLDLWLDCIELRAGDSLKQRIPDGIEESDFLVVVLSPNSVTSRWVKREIKLALTEEIEVNKIKVIALLFTQCDVPRFLSGKIWADFRNSFDEGLVSLLRGLFRETEVFRCRIRPDSILKPDLCAIDQAVSFLMKNDESKDFFIIYEDNGFKDELQSIWWTEKELKEKLCLKGEQVSSYVNGVVRSKNAIPLLIKNYALIMPKYISTAFDYLGKDVGTSHLIGESIDIFTKKLFLLIADKISTFGEPTRVRAMRSIDGNNLLKEIKKASKFVTSSSFGFEEYILGCDSKDMIHLGFAGRKDLSNTEKSIYDVTMVVPRAAIPSDTLRYLGIYPLPPDAEIFSTKWVKFFMPEIAFLHIRDCSYSGQLITKHLNRIGFRKNDYFHFGYE